MIVSMDELYAYQVKRPSEPVDLDRLRRDRADAWRLYLGTDEQDLEKLLRLARQAADRDDVACFTFRIVSSGTINLDWRPFG